MNKAICIMTILLVFLSFVGCGSSSTDREGYGNQGKSVDDVLQEQMSDSAQSAGDASATVPKGSSADVRAAGDTEPADVDLTKLSSTMVYSEVYSMMNSPENYMGKRVRMRGSFAFAEGDNKYYFACLISDATACCAQGIEFVLKDERQFPDDYPERGTEITVYGVFDTYKEGERQYCQLVDAVMEA